MKMTVNVIAMERTRNVMVIKMKDEDERDGEDDESKMMVTIPVHPSEIEELCGYCCSSSMWCLSFLSSLSLSVSVAVSAAQSSASTKTS